ncbi:hypothetical protein [Aeromicrobium sp. CF3.5]|uniref:hypothetical protein n=1 Tax=Aeromicrobium sp. CF3.5 TaxID=3373078 RepID=UPI003EE7C7F4
MITSIRLLIQDLNVRVVNAVTGELLRELTIDPTATTNPETKKSRTRFRRFGTFPSLERSPWSG